MSGGPITVRVTVGGPEVAKWLAQQAFHRGGSMAAAPGVYITDADAPVVIELNDTLRLPTLADDAYVEFRVVSDKAFQYVPNLDSPALVAAAAAISVDEVLDGLLSRADKLSIDVEMIR